MRIHREKMADFVAACHQVAAMGLVRCSSGNMSCRLDNDRLLIKSSRAWMADLTKDDVAICRMDGTSLNRKKPSVEIALHAGIMRARPDVNVVLHFQSPFATTIACWRAEKINFCVIPEVPYYIGAIGIVPYILPGSPQLANAAIDVMKKHELAILASHGQVTVGADFRRTIQRAVFFELACEILVRGGRAVRPLTPRAVDQLRAAQAARKGA